MKKITGWWLLAFIVMLLFAAGGFVQFYLKDNLVVSMVEHHEHAHAAESAPDENTETALGNLVANYSFEVGGDLDIDGWTPVGEDPSTSAWRDSAISAFGTSSAALASGEGSRGVDLTWSQAILDFTPDRDITIKSHVKTEDVYGSAFLRVVGLQRTSQGSNYIIWYNLDASSGTTDWTAFEGTVYVPEEVNALEVSVGLYGRGKVWFDEVSLSSSDPSREQLPRDTCLLLNPDFSRGLASWYFFSTEGTPSLDWGITDGGGTHGPSLYVTQPQPVDEANYSGFYQAVNGLDRTLDTAVLTGWARSSGLEGSAKLNLTFYCLGTKYIYDSPVTLSGTQEWQQLDVETKIPENADSVWVRLIVTGRGTAYFDDLDFRLVPSGS